ncbi:MAG: hypothetical protein Q4C54_01420 [Clostridia bacterium]|nr:hypothetical protein [Clostridia bacterium]
MVKQKRGGRKRGILTRKLMRDMKHSAMQFFAMLMLCFLGTWVFAGLDANWRTMALSYDTYFTQNNIADFWVKDASFSNAAQRKVQHLPGVGQMICRTNLRVDCPDLGTDTDPVQVQMLAYEGPAEINIPLIHAGESLAAGDVRGILLEEQFAKAQGLKVGDRIKLRLPTGDTSFTVRGLVLSPEYIVTSRDVSP